MTPARVIIAAAGSQHKWRNHLETPTHLLPVNGEPLLARTIRQAHRITEDVHITTPDDDRYDLPGATRHIRGPEGNEYTSTRNLWSTKGRTVLLLGDVYFTDRAMDVIRYGSPSSYQVYGRYRGSRHTGTPYGEIFAVSWGPAQHAKMDSLLAEVDRLRATRYCMRPAGWVLLRLWQGTPVRQHLVRRPYWVEIDDLTDDIDGPEDYKRHPAFREVQGAAT